MVISTMLFFLLQGTIGFEQHIDKCLDLSQYLYNKIKNREGYEMVFDGVVSLSSSVLFQGFYLSSQSMRFNTPRVCVCVCAASTHQRLLLVHPAQPERNARRRRAAGETAQGESPPTCCVTFSFMLLFCSELGTLGNTFTQPVASNSHVHIVESREENN